MLKKIFNFIRYNIIERYKIYKIQKLEDYKLRKFQKMYNDQNESKKYLNFWLQEELYNICCKYFDCNEFTIISYNTSKQNNEKTFFVGYKNIFSQYDIVPCSNQQLINYMKKECPIENIKNDAICVFLNRNFTLVYKTIN